MGNKLFAKNLRNLENLKTTKIQTLRRSHTPSTVKSACGQRSGGTRRFYKRLCSFQKVVNAPGQRAEYLNKTLLYVFKIYYFRIGVRSHSMWGKNRSTLEEKFLDRRIY